MQIARLHQLDHVPAVLRLHGFVRVFAGLQARTASANGLTILSGVNQPRSPPLSLEESMDSFLARSSNLPPFLQAIDHLLRERLGRNQDVARVVFLLGRAGDLRFVFGAQLLLRRLLVLQVLLRHGLLQHIQPSQLEQGRGVRRSCRRRPSAACWPTTSARIRLSSAWLRCSGVSSLEGLPRDGLDVVLEEILGDVGAVDRRDRGGGVRGSSAPGRRLWVGRRPARPERRTT